MRRTLVLGAMALCLAACSGGDDQAADSYEGAAAEIAPAAPVNLELAKDAASMDTDGGEASPAPVQPANTIA